MIRDWFLETVLPCLLAREREVALESEAVSFMVIVWVVVIGQGLKFGQIYTGGPESDPARGRCCHWRSDVTCGIVILSPT